MLRQSCLLCPVSIDEEKAEQTPQVKMIFVFVEQVE